MVESYKFDDMNELNKFVKEQGITRQDIINVEATFSGGFRIIVWREE